MKKFALLLVTFSLIIFGAGMAFANVQEARDAMIAYVGTEAFTKLNATERQACVEWLSYGGTMKDECKKAVMRLVAIDPDAISQERRQALVSVAAGTESSVVSDVSNTTPVNNEKNTTVKKKDDKATAAIVGGLVGLVAGLVISNNHHRHHHSTPVYQPQPPSPVREPSRGNAPPRNHPQRPPHR